MREAEAEARRRAEAELARTRFNAQQELNVALVTEMRHELEEHTPSVRLQLTVSLPSQSARSSAPTPSSLPGNRSARRRLGSSWTGYSPKRAGRCRMPV